MAVRRESYLDHLGRSGRPERKRLAARAARDAYWLAATFAILACWPGPGSLGQKLEATFGVAAAFIGFYAIVVFFIAAITEDR